MSIFKKRKKLDDIVLEYMKENNDRLSELIKNHNQLIQCTNDLSDYTKEMAKRTNELAEFVVKMKEERHLSTLN